MKQHLRSLEVKQKSDDRGSFLLQIRYTDKNFILLK